MRCAQVCDRVPMIYLWRRTMKIADIDRVPCHVRYWGRADINPKRQNVCF